jgi:site-specific DNA-cytosine methylase
MTGIDFVDFNGLAGFMSLGLVEQGFNMVARTGTLDFGNVQCEANRHLLGNQWEAKFGDEIGNWLKTSGHIPVVAGLPPCSGWSCWTGPANRGPEAKAHQHTRALMGYAGSVKPDAVVFECVPQAFSQGREVMQKYRSMVEDVSERHYDLHHVKMNVLMTGGFAYRPRYFWVAVRRGMYFAPRAEWPMEVPSIMDVIGDLQDMPQSWGPQPYVAPHSHWICKGIDHDGLVDGHVGHDNIHMIRIKEVLWWLRHAGQEWRWGEGLSLALKRVYDLYGQLPPSWENKADKILERRFDMGFSLPYRWPGNAWANVLTGGCLDMVVHPTRDRCITHREAARIQGLPDSWRIAPSHSYTPLSDSWGKAVSKNAGAWIGKYVRQALEGTVSEYDMLASGVKIGDNEWFHDTDKSFSRPRARDRYFPGTKGGIQRAYAPELWPWGKQQAAAVTGVQPLVVEAEEEEPLPERELALVG